MCGQLHTKIIMNFITTWGETFTGAFQGLSMGLIAFLPKLILAVVIFLIGWWLASMIERALRQVIGALKLDRLFNGSMIETAAARANMKVSVGGFVGWIVKWFIVTVFLIASLNILGLSQVNDVLKEVVLSYLPQVFVAALILVIATIVADAVRKIVTGTARSANLRTANMMGTIVYYAIWIFAIIIALSQLGIAPQFMQILFTGIIAMLAIAGGLAFGLGGKEVAGRALEHVREDMSGKM